MLLPLFLTLVLTSCVAQQCAVSDPRVDCGQDGISASNCTTRGCCWDNTTAGPWCYYPGGSGVPINTVHMVFACHLDVGFLDTATNIVNLYFDTYFPQAAATGLELRMRGGPERLMFMTHTYLISLYYDCPPGYGLHCPNQTAMDTVTQAILAGDITWHAFPFNSELELYDEIMLKFGVSLTHSLDAKFGLAPKTTLSQRDVPGITRAAIPTLLSVGVEAISVGVNEASTPPNVPRAFRWQEPTTGKTILAMWHPKGYGGITLQDAVMAPGFDRALVFAWRNDNSGPPSADEVISDFATVQAEFPGASVIASTFDMFTEELQRYADNLPLLTQELGDTWIYGVPSDPLKTAQIRAVQRSIYQCQQQQKLSTCQNSNYNFFNFSRQFLKAGEHTWGEDVKTWLNDTTNWSNTLFNAARSQPNFQTIQGSWEEQFRWAFDYPLQALPAGDPLLQLIQQEFAALVPTIPSLTGYSSVILTDSLMFKTSRFTLGFDSITGAITTLVDSSTSLSWASLSSPLALLQYNTYDQNDYNTYLNEYCDISPVPDWFPLDFGKPGMTSTHNEIAASLVSFWQKGQSGSVDASFLLQLAVRLNPSDTSLHTSYGAPSTVWVQVDVSSQGLNITLSAFNKTATRLAEAMFFRMVPPLDNQRVWSLNKLGLWVDPLDVESGGAQVLHGIGAEQGLKCGNKYGSIIFSSLDAPIVAVGTPTAFPEPSWEPPNPTAGTSFVLWDNLWGTNYVMWWPYFDDSQMGNLKYRFSVTFE